MADRNGSRFPAISLKQPNADRVVRGQMRRDSRSRPTRFRGWILLHASQTFRRDDATREGDADLARGKILGLVQLADCVKDGDRWTYVWKNPRRFRSAIPYRGHYSIPFYVPVSILRETPAARMSPGTLQD